MSTIDYPCRECGAKKGEFCTITVSGENHPQESFHQKRIFDAAAKGKQDITLEQLNEFIRNHGIL